MATWKKLVQYNSGDTVTVATPTADTHAATKAYVDTLSGFWTRDGTDLEPHDGGGSWSRLDLSSIASGATATIFDGSGATPFVVAHDTPFIGHKSDDKQVNIGGGSSADRTKGPFIQMVGTSASELAGFMKLVNGTNGRIEFHTYDSGGTLVTSKFGADGSFDLNSTLDVSGNAVFGGTVSIDGVAKISNVSSGAVLLETTQSSKWIQIKSNEGIYFTTNGSNYNYIDSSNNLHTQDIHSKDIYLDQARSNWRTIQYRDTDNSNAIQAYVSSYNTSASDGFLRLNAIESLQFRTGDTERLKLTSSSATFAGTATFVGEVSTSSSGGGFKVKNASTATKWTQITYDGLYGSGDQHLYISAAANKDIKFYPGGASKQIFYDSGNVWIDGKINSGAIGVGGTAYTNSHCLLSLEDNSASSTDYNADGSQLYIRGYNAAGEFSGIGYNWSGSDNHAPAVWTGVKCMAYDGHTKAEYIIATRDTTGNTNPTRRLTIGTDGNATFAGDVTISNSIPLLYMNDTSGADNNQIIFQAGGSNIFRVGTDITTNDGTSTFEITNGGGNTPFLNISSTGVMQLKPSENYTRVFLANSGGTAGSIYAYGNTLGFLDQNGNWGYKITQSGSHLWKSANADKMELTSGAELRVKGHILSKQGSYIGVRNTADSDYAYSFKMPYGSSEDLEINPSLHYRNTVVKHGQLIIKPPDGTDSVLHLDAGGNGNARIELDAGGTGRHPELHYKFDGTTYWTTKADPDRSHDFVLRDDANSSAVQLRIAQSTGDATFAGTITQSGNYFTIDHSAQNGIKIKGNDTACLYIYDKADDSLSGGLTFSHDTAEFLVYTNGVSSNSEALKIASDNTATFAGNVGIGGAISHALTVHGEVKFNLGGSANMTFNTVGGDAAYYMTDSDGTIRVNIDTEGVSYFKGGTVGIGVSPTVGMLHIEKSSDGGWLSYMNNTHTGGYGLKIKAGGDSGDYAFLVENQDSSFHKFKIDGDGVTTMNAVSGSNAITPALHLMKINSSGVGGDDAGAAIDFWAENADGGTNQLTSRISGFAQSATGGSGFNGGLKFFVTSDGYNPVQALHIDHNKNATFSGDLVIPQDIFHDGDNDTALRFTDNQLAIITGNATRLTVNNNGTTFNTAAFWLLGTSYNAKVAMDGSDRLNFIVGNNGTESSMEIDQTNNVRAPNGHIQVVSDSKKFTAGVGGDIQMFHDGSNSHITNSTGHLKMTQTHSTGNTEFEISGSGYYHFDANFTSGNKQIARFSADPARPIAFGWIDSGSKMSLYTPDNHSLVLGTGALGTNNLEINAAGDTTFSGTIIAAGNIGVGDTPVVAIDVHSSGTEVAAVFGMADDDTVWVSTRVAETVGKYGAYAFMVGDKAVDGVGSTNTTAYMSSAVTQAGTLKGNLKFNINSGDGLHNCLELTDAGTAILNTNQGSSIMWFKHQGTANGAVYGTGTSFGLLDQGGNWAYKHTNDSSHTWYVNDTEKMSLNSSGNLDVTGTVTGTEFYIGGWARFTGTDGCYWSSYDTHFRGVDNTTLKVQMGGHTSCNIALQGSDGLNGYVASIPNYIGFKDLGGSWSYRIHNDGNQVWYDNGETARMELHTSGDLDASRFRAKANTNYYVDPDGTSALYSLQVYAGLGMNSTDITAVKDIAFTSFAANLFGIMRADHNNAASDSLSLNSPHDITMHLDTNNTQPNVTNYFRIKSDTTGTGASVFWVRDDGQVSCLGVTETSSMVYKKNITKIENPLDKIEKLRGIEFDYIDSNEHSIGMVAEEVAEIFPELVIKDDTGRVSAMSYTRMTAVLLEAVKELNKKLINNNNN